jgi:hypothetical protein
MPKKAAVADQSGEEMEEFTVEDLENEEAANQDADPEEETDDAEPEDEQPEVKQPAGNQADDDSDKDSEGEEFDHQAALARIRSERPELLTSDASNADDESDEDDPDHIYDELGRVDPEKLARNIAERESVRAEILADIRNSVPELTEAQLQTLRKNLQNAELKLSELQGIHASRALTKQVMAEVELARRSGQLPPAKKAPPPPTPNNAGAAPAEDPLAGYTEAEQKEIRRMARANGIPEAELAKTYGKYRPKTKK